MFEVAVCVLEIGIDVCQNGEAIVNSVRGSHVFHFRLISGHYFQRSRKFLAGYQIGVLCQ